MERESLDFHQAVANGYRRLARENADRYVIVEATGTPESVARHVRDGLNRWLPVPVEDDTDIAPVSQLLGRGGPEAPPPPPPSSNVG